MSENEREGRPTGGEAQALGSTSSDTRQEARLRAQMLRSKIKTVQGVEQNFSGEETMSWLVKMDDSVQAADETIVPGKLLDASQMTMPRLIDIIFDSLQRYSFEFNKKNEFVINCLRPENFQEKIDHFNRRKVRFMKGHLSTDEYSMVFYATDATVDVYIIPTDFLVGFDPEESDFPSFLTMKKLSVQDSSSWGIDGTKISLDEFPRLSRRLLGQLIKVVRGEAVSSEQFTLSTSKPMEEEVEPDRTFEELDDELEALHPGEQLPSQPKQSPKPLSTLARSTQQEIKKPLLQTPAAPAAPAANQEPHTIEKPRLTAQMEADLMAFTAQASEKAAELAQSRSSTNSTESAPAVSNQPTPAAEEPAQKEMEEPIYQFGKREKKTLIDEEVPRPRSMPETQATSLPEVPEVPEVPEPAVSSEPVQPEPTVAPRMPEPVVPEPVKPAPAVEASAASAEQFFKSELREAESFLEKSAVQLMRESKSEDVPARQAKETVPSSSAAEDAADALKKEQLKDKIKLSKRHTEPLLTEADAASAESIKEQVDSAQENVVDACCAVVTGIEGALEALQAAGIEAMRKDDVKRVNEVMDESRRLRAIREKLVLVAEEIADV